jgi:hypothetical protein
MQANVRIPDGPLLGDPENADPGQPAGGTPKPNGTRKDPPTPKEER